MILNLHYVIFSVSVGSVGAEISEPLTASSESHEGKEVFQSFVIQQKYESNA